MKEDKFISEAIIHIDGMAAYVPDDEAQYRDEDLRLMYQYMNRLFDLVLRYREWITSESKKSKLPTNADSYHVGKSNYSAKEIQPWDCWREYGMNPWDADIAKRLMRTKVETHVDPADARIEDYEKIKHICDKRIDQIRNGDTWYKNVVIPPWVERNE